MSEQYLHYLIPRKKDFAPSLPKVDEFFQELVAIGVLKDPELRLSQQDGELKTRTVENPFALGETFTSSYYDWRQLSFADELARENDSLCDFCASASSCWKPRVPPIPVDFDDEYSFSVSCRVASTLRSTSDVIVAGPPRPDRPRFWMPCGVELDTGYFTNPHDGSVLAVPEIGCARFCIEFELGRWLFPDLSAGSLEIIHPAVLRCAEDVFGVPFGQGCGSL